MPRPASSFLGKYRVLVLAVAAFFSLSIGVYSLNFMLLRQVELDAERITEGGKLRGYSQQLAKAILTLSHEVSSGEPIQTSQAQISEAHLAFDQSFGRIRAIGDTRDMREEELLDKLGKQWGPLRNAAVRLLGTTTIDESEIQTAVTLSNTRNVRVMQLADDLTRHEERLAAERARSMRYVQFGAIALALLNFLFIVVHVARRLRRSDHEAEQARRETGDILRTVREGLFLIDRTGVVGTQRSAHLEKVFPHPLQPGDNFLAALAGLVSPDAMLAARQYVELLFNERVKPALLADLNPLHRVAIRQQGQQEAIYLNFGFHPVRGDGNSRVSALLVAAVDVSKEVRLEQKLAGIEARAQQEVSVLLGILENDPAEILRFLAESRQRMERINERLRDVPADPRAYSAVVASVFQDIHVMKGEAGALAIGTIADQAHQFEETLEALRIRRVLTGDDLIPVATGIGRLQQEFTKVETVARRVAGYAESVQGNGAAPTASTDRVSSDEEVYASVQRIQRLALGVAAELNKKLRVETSLPHIDGVPSSVQRVLRDGLPLLVKNAVVHGIESTEERVRAGKDEEGRLRVELIRTANGGFELTIADDGRGIDVDGVRRRLVQAGHRDAEMVAAMSDREVVATLFQPGVSTASEVTRHAGRGVGLDVIGTLARETGARLKLTSAPRAYTRFTLQWSPA